MNRYTIYCTEAQAKKTLELGAPIEFEVECPVNLETLERSPYPDIKIGKDGEPILIIPTTEQMIGWLEEQGQSIEVCRLNKNNPNWSAFVDDTQIIGKYYSTRKGAILDAIDAALEYLSNNNENK